MKRRSESTEITKEDLVESFGRLEREVNERFEKIEMNELAHLSSRIDSLQQDFSKMLLDYQNRVFARILDLQKDFNSRMDKIFYCALGTLVSVIIAVTVAILKIGGIL